MVVEVDQLGIDNVLFADEPDHLEEEPNHLEEEPNHFDEEDEKPLIQMKTTPRIKLKKEPKQSGDEETFDSNDGNEVDPIFDMGGDIASDGQTSDEDAMISVKEICEKAKSKSSSKTKSRSRSKTCTKTKPVKKKKTTGIKKPKRVPLPEHLMYVHTVILIHSSNSYHRY